MVLSKKKDERRSFICLRPRRVLHVHGFDLILGQGTVVKVEVFDPTLHGVRERPRTGETTDGKAG